MWGVSFLFIYIVAFQPKRPEACWLFKTSPGTVWLVKVGGWGTRTPGKHSTETHPTATA